MVGKRLSTAVAALIGLALAANALADDYKIGDLTIKHPWAQASTGLANAGAAYLEIMNDGKTPDLLIAVDTPVAEHVQLHAHLIEGGVALMRPIEAIEVSPGAPVILQPGGLHVMLMGLKSRLVEGDQFSLSLTFQRAGTISISVPIKASNLGGDNGHGTDQHKGNS